MVSLINQIIQTLWKLTNFYIFDSTSIEVIIKAKKLGKQELFNLVISSVFHKIGETGKGRRIVKNTLRPFDACFFCPEYDVCPGGREALCLKGVGSRSDVVRKIRFVLNGRSNVDAKIRSIHSYIVNMVRGEIYEKKRAESRGKENILTNSREVFLISQTYYPLYVPNLSDQRIVRFVDKLYRDDLNKRILRAIITIQHFYPIRFKSIDKDDIYRALPNSKIISELLRREDSYLGKPEKAYTSSLIAQYGDKRLSGIKDLIEDIAGELAPRKLIYPLYVGFKRTRKVYLTVLDGLVSISADRYRWFDFSDPLYADILGFRHSIIELMWLLKLRKEDKTQDMWTIFKFYKREKKHFDFKLQNLNSIDGAMNVFYGKILSILKREASDDKELEFRNDNMLGILMKIRKLEFDFSSGGLISNLGNDLLNRDRIIINVDIKNLTDSYSRRISVTLNERVRRFNETMLDLLESTSKRKIDLAAELTAKCAYHLAGSGIFTPLKG